MPSNQNHRSTDFSRFDDMANEELEQLLRLDAQNTEGTDSDLEMVLYVTEMLAARRKKSNKPEKSAEKAFESFQKNYMPYDDTENSVEADSNLEIVKKSNAKRHRWTHRLSTIAAALAVVVVCSITTSALGFDIFGAIAKWTQETFHFGYANQVDTTEQTSNNTSLQQLLIDYDIFTPLAPTWFPEGYELVDVTVTETPMRETYLALYENKGKEMKVQIVGFLDADPQQVEKSDSLLEVYESNGITYYFFADNKLLQAAWVNESYECYISGQMNIEDIKRMIDSIAKE